MKPADAIQESTERVKRTLPPAINPPHVFKILSRANIGCFSLNQSGFNPSSICRLKRLFESGKPHSPQYEIDARNSRTLVAPSQFSPAPIVRANGRAGEN